MITIHSITGDPFTGLRHARGIPSTLESPWGRGAVMSADLPSRPTARREGTFTQPPERSPAELRRAAATALLREVAVDRARRRHERWLGTLAESLETVGETPPPPTVRVTRELSDQYPPDAGIF